MGIFEATEITVIQIRMSIKVNHANGFLLSKRSQNGERTQMIASGSKRPDALGLEGRKVSFNPQQGIIHISRIDGGIPQVSNVGEIIGHDMRGLVHAPDH